MTRRQRRSPLGQELSRRRFLGLAGSAGLGGLLMACSGGGGSSRPEGWSEATHSNDAAPDYATVFPKDRVNQITFTVSPGDWQRMLDDLTGRLGPRGEGGGRRPQASNDDEGLVIDNPIWVPATVGFNGLQWTNVGLRFKGNSSLRRSWLLGSDKLPFKLDFDEFEDDHAEIRNQRFYGFKQLSLSNNLNDEAMMREALAYDVLDEAGLVAAETGFYEVLLNRGEGTNSLGLYTMIEVIDDTVIQRYFEDSTGNIYEAEGLGATLGPKTAGEIESSFQVESDETKADWNDIRELASALNSGERLEDAAAWRASLQAVFDVEVFLEWLAFSALLQHWDSYGTMTHNYYLYNDPATGRMNWISWDHSLVLYQVERQTGRARVSYDKSGVGEDWPLIHNLFTQPEYVQKYNDYLRALLTGPFEPSHVRARIDEYAALLRAPASKEIADYDAALEALVESVEYRVAEAQAYLASL